MPVLDHDSPIPLYHQLQMELVGQIRDGELLPGAQLPSETELCNRYSVSRTVVRSALQGLANQDLIEKRRGVGSFVAWPKISEKLFQRMSGVHDEMSSRGFSLTTEILDLTCAPASALVATRLGLAEGGQVHRLVRRRSVEGEPLLVGTTHLPVSLVPHLDIDALRNGSLYRLLRSEYGLVVAKGHRTFESVAAAQDEARLLHVEVGAPLSLIRSIGYTADGIPVEYFESLHRGDRAVFEVDVVTSAGGAGEEGASPTPDGSVTWDELSADLTA